MFSAAHCRAVQHTGEHVGQCRIEQPIAEKYSMDSAGHCRAMQHTGEQCGQCGTVQDNAAHCGKVCTI